MRIVLVAAVLGVALGCSGAKTSDSDHAGDMSGGAGGSSANAGGSGPNAGSSGGAARAGNGGSAGGAAAAGGAPGGAGLNAGGAATQAGRSGGAGMPASAAGSGGMAGAVAGGGSGGTGAELLPLPDGSRELHGVVNLVSADAAAELEAFLDETIPVSEYTPSVPTATNLFLEHYVEQYDFLYLFTDHALPDALAAGIFEYVTSSATPGTGLDYDLAREGLKTNGRLRGVIGMQYSPGYFGPLAHELLHNWANDLDLSFGFGIGLDYDDPVHWGYAGVHGQIGGFDPATLVCESPSGAMPPNCDDIGGGRSRYVVGAFGPFTNGPSIPYAPLELYLMGLLPRAEVPNEIPVLVDGDLLEDSFDTTTVTMKIEAAGVKTVKVDDIVARHGEVELLPESKRGFSAAFIVVSATPADDSVLDEVGHIAAVFGSRETDLDIPNFAALTGNHGTLATTLGPRRNASDAPPVERVPQGCDLDAQDCGGTKVCYVGGKYQTRCALSRGFGRDHACTYQNDCAKGLDCAPSLSQSDTFACEPYCSSDDNAADACSSTCQWIQLSSDGQVTHGLCQAP
jgi:hypothetical protein